MRGDILHCAIFIKKTSLQLYFFIRKNWHNQFSWRRRNQNTEIKWNLDCLRKIIYPRYLLELYTSQMTIFLIIFLKQLACICKLKSLCLIYCCLATFRSNFFFLLWPKKRIWLYLYDNILKSIFWVDVLFICIWWYN